MKSPPAKTRIGFVGLGYVGLSTAVCFASRGFRVLGVDVDQKKVKAIEEGSSPIREEGLEQLLHSSIESRRFSITSDYSRLADAELIFITVGTPSKGAGGIDTGYVEAASREIGRLLSRVLAYRLVVVKSTVTPGTTETLVRPIIEEQSGKKVGSDVGLASNPEFLHEGSAIRETLHPDAVAIGGHDGKSTATLLSLYKSFYGKLPPTVLTTPSNAEMMKYAINAGRASQLSFVNTIANLCTRIPGCDYDEVRKGLSIVAKMDERYLVAGLGFGGSCLPKDSRALAVFLRSAGLHDEVVASALKANDNQVNEAIRMAEEVCGSLGGKRVAVLGLAFKAGTDDIRESVSINLVRKVIKADATVSVYDPVAMKNARTLLGSRVTYAKSPRDCLKGAECVFIATGWNAFKNLKPKDFKTLMATPTVIDGRRIYNQGPFRREGVRIVTIGTGPALNETVKESAEELPG